MKKENNIKKNYIYFYTDSSSDLPLCYQADNITVVNADEKLSLIAKEKGWNQQHWDLSK